MSAPPCAQLIATLSLLDFLENTPRSLRHAALPVSGFKHRQTAWRTRGSRMWQYNAELHIRKSRLTLHFGVASHGFHFCDLPVLLRHRKTHAHICFVYWTSRVQLSTRTPGILIKIFVFPQSLLVTNVTVPYIGHDCFSLYPTTSSMILLFDGYDLRSS